MAMTELSSTIVKARDQNLIEGHIPSKMDIPFSPKSTLVSTLVTT